MNLTKSYLTEIAVKELTKDEIAQAAIKELQARGARVRKVHNVAAYRKRRFQVEKGWSDVQGYSSTGVCLLCEVKTRKDKFTQEQIDRLEDLDRCGGISLVAIQDGISVKLLMWAEAKLKFGIEVN